jgi:hypothetical protein
VTSLTTVISRKTCTQQGTLHCGYLGLHRSCFLTGHNNHRSANESTSFRARRCVPLMRFFCLRAVEFERIARIYRIHRIELRDITEFCVYESSATARSGECTGRDRRCSGRPTPAILHELRVNGHRCHSTIARGPPPGRPLGCNILAKSHAVLSSRARF